MAVLFHEPIFATVVESGDKLYFFEAGTTTDLTVYTDNALNTAHPQPIVADSDGQFPAIYLSPTTGDAKVRLDSADDTQRWTVETFPIDDLTTLTSDVAQLKVDVSAVEGRMSTAESEIDTLQNESSDYETRITAIEDAGFSSPLIATGKSTSNSPSFTVNFPVNGNYHIKANLNMYSISRTVEGSQTITLKVGSTVVDSVIATKDGDDGSAHRDFAYVGPAVAGTYSHTGGSSQETITVERSGDNVFNIRECYLEVTRLS